ncbi:lamin tail domain-containing protein, partial [Myxococcota bacterium]|nr:lamin tail domain-containing protein [Myxococcota bacterium]
MSAQTFASTVPARSQLRLRATVVLTLLAGCSPSTKSADDPDDRGDSVAGDSGEAVEEVPAAAAPWVRDERAAPGSITFNELQYHPASDDQPEWIELYNPMALDMDLSGWSI